MQYNSTDLNVIVHSLFYVWPKSIERYKVPHHTDNVTIIFGIL